MFSTESSIKLTIVLKSFKLESSAADALRDYSSNKVDYVKFEIDTTQEIIRSLNSDKFKGNTEKLQEKVSTSTPNYHLFKFKYDHQSKEQIKNIFIYSIPSEVQIPIKKMLYASCKSAFVGGMSNFGIEDMLSIEIDSPSEVDHQSLYRQIHPETIPKAQNTESGEFVVKEAERRCCQIQ